MRRLVGTASPHGSCPASSAGNTDARFRVSTRMTFIWQRLRRASPCHALGFSAAHFWTPCISLRFLDFETSEFSFSCFFGARLPVPDPVPRSEEALCDDTPAQVNGGSVRDGTCKPRLWNLGASLTLALELLDPLKHPVHGNILLVLSICSLDIVLLLNSLQWHRTISVTV